MEHTGEIIFACGRRYTEVPQKAINGLDVGTVLTVRRNEDAPKIPQPYGDISCFGCPCKRRAKHKEFKFFRQEDIDPDTDKAIKAPSGVGVSCAVAELIPDKK